MEEASTLAQAPAAVTLFVCSNCARPPQAHTSAGRSRPAIPNFGWPWPVREVVTPCTGRLQPEHVLKAFESGASVVCTVACQDDKCHYVEGSKRCARRVDTIRAILREIGLGGERLLYFSLPGTAVEDMALSAGKPAPAGDAEALDLRIGAIRKQVVEAVGSLPPSPLGAAPVVEDSYQEATDDDNEE